MHQFTIPSRKQALQEYHIRGKALEHAAQQLFIFPSLSKLRRKQHLIPGFCCAKLLESAISLRMRSGGAPQSRSQVPGWRDFTYRGDETYEDRRGTRTGEGGRKEMRTGGIGGKGRDERGGNKE